MKENMIKKYYKSIITWIVVGILIMAVIMMISDFRAVINLLSDINLKLLPLILILAPLNYLFRYIKWNYYLKQIDLTLPPEINRAIFISGLSMTITPGKVGELLKSYLIKEYNDTEISRTSPVILAERVTDAISMIFLASIGSLAYSHGRYILLITLCVLFAGIAALYYEGLFNLFIKGLSRIKYINKYTHLLVNFQRSARELFGIKSLVFAIFIGIISWGFEGIIVFLSLRALGGDISLLGSIFVVSFSSIMGAISILPGGLGITEGSIMGILILLGVSRQMAAATTLITRFSTLWLGVITGIFGLFFVRNYIYNNSE
ncbi:MAG: lysylphosphatidylglycerol synthase transmembrane domain-containing protein [Halanaerobiaceae bacterium]